MLNFAHRSSYFTAAALIYFQNMPTQLKRLHLLIVLAISLIAVSCGDDTEFRVTGTVEGMGTRNTYMIYVDDGTVREVHSPSLDGKFNFVGSSPDYTLIEIYTSGKEFVGRAIVKNGQTLKCKFDISAPYHVEIKGNKPSEEWGKFLYKNREILSSGNIRAINDLVEEYALSHKDNIVSSLLMMTQFNAIDEEAKAESIFAQLSPEARPDRLVDDYRLLLANDNNAYLNGKIAPFTLVTASDSIVRYYPGSSSYSLFFFTASQGERRDTITPVLSYFYDKYSRRRLRIIEVSFSADTLLWKNIARRDTVNRWPQLWVPGGASNPNFTQLNVPRLPYYILSDSMGKQVYRGSSIKLAMDSLENKVNRRK